MLRQSGRLPFFRRDAREVDDKGNTKMTLKYLKQLCLEQKLYSTPQLNDKLYLHFKGFVKIENLEQYSDLRSLWLEGNGIGKIENLEALTQLRACENHLDHLIDALKSLSLPQQNCLEQIENLEALVNLDTLNLGNNLIRRIENLSKIPRLKTLQLDHNFLRTADDIRHLIECPSISILDLSNNKLEDPEIVEVFSQMPELSVLNLMSNPVVPKIANYRRVLVCQIKKLTYLDDRPVFDNERLATEAWAIGGLEAEKAERFRQREEEREAQNRNFMALKALQEKARQKRLENYGPDKEPEFPPKLEKFRDEMLRKVVPESDGDNREGDDGESDESDADSSDENEEAGNAKEIESDGDGAEEESGIDKCGPVHSEPGSAVDAEAAVGKKSSLATAVDLLEEIYDEASEPRACDGDGGEADSGQNPSNQTNATGKTSEHMPCNRTGNPAIADARAGAFHKENELASSDAAVDAPKEEAATAACVEGRISMAAQDERIKVRAADPATLLVDSNESVLDLEETVVENVAAISAGPLLGGQSSRAWES